LKSFLIIPLLLFLIVTPAFGQLLSDKTGLVNHFDVETGGYTFDVKIVSNFDVIEHEFDKDEKRLTIFINSGLENNLGEIIIPQLLLGGNFTFYLNDMQYVQKIKSNDKISFITLNFTGIGNNKIDIIATETFAEVEEKLNTFPCKPSLASDFSIPVNGTSTQSTKRDIRELSLLLPHYPPPPNSINY